MHNRLATLAITLLAVSMTASAQTPRKAANGQTAAASQQKKKTGNTKSTQELTSLYLNYVKKMAKGKKQIAQRNSSDPATVTREQATKDNAESHNKAKEESFDDFLGDITSDFDDFLDTNIQDFDDFFNKVNEAFADFMRDPWTKFEADEPIEMPKEKEVPPVVKPQPTKPQPQPKEDRVLPIPTVVVEVPKPEPQPQPIAPIEPQPQEEAPQQVTFTLFGSECKVRFADSQYFKLEGCKEGDIADAWKEMITPEYNNTIHDCLQIRQQRHLSDWAYLHLVDSAAHACMGNTNEATLMMAYIFCQSGYKMRMGICGDRLYMLFGSHHVIMERPYYTIKGEYYYPYGGNPETLFICEVPFPQEQSLSMLVTEEQQFDYEPSAPRSLKAASFPKVLVSATINKKALGFYESYPPSMLGDNQETIWAMYANMPMPKAIGDTFMKEMKQKIEGLGQQQAMERLLNFVQTAFVYEYDDKVWGHDRAFFPEETLYYPYCDCEDRSILLSRMVRDLLGLRCVLIHYPGHLAMAVHFTDEVKGDCVMLNGEKFVVCDPTYLYAHVGETMPGMDNSQAKVILLENK